MDGGIASSNPGGKSGPDRDDEFDEERPLGFCRGPNIFLSWKFDRERGMGWDVIVGLGKEGFVI